MGISFSCPFATYSDVENALESVVVKSISFGDDNVRTPVRSVNFGSLDLEPRILKSSGSGKMIVERSVSFKGTELEKMISHKTPVLDKETDDSVDCANGMEAMQKSSIFDPANPHHEAAIKLQKVYKSFRTRRKLADCAVLVEQSWWKLLDFAELKRSSISFFDIEKHETAISRWSRARTRAAKVGKGLSKNDKAQKLALQHWLEAIDPRHRYGHNLHFYYVKWLHSKSREPFFYWLDIGEGKEVNLEKCPRSKLQQQCIKYLGPMERKAYEAVVEDGKFMYKQTGELLHTTGDAKWIFVLSTSKNLYVGKKQKGKFQHSSFLAGGVTLAAGRLIIENGVLKAVWPHSGHYRPTEENFQDFLSFLRENNVDLADVQTSPMDDEERLLNKQRSSKHLRSNSSEEDLIQTVDELEIEETIAEDSTLDSRKSVQRESSATPEEQKLTPLRNFSRKLTILQIPKGNESLERIESDIRTPRSSINSVVVGPQAEDGYESADEGFTKDQSHIGTMQGSSNEEHEGNEVEHIPEEEILRRINCKKETKSYQLGRQLSCKWTTGAGPRIGCVRDYPSELQVRALEQVNLSPRSMGHSRTAGGLSRRISSPSDFGGEEADDTFSAMLAKTKSLQMILPLSSPQSSPLGKGHQ